MTETCSNIVRQHCGDSCLAEIKKKTKKHILDRPVSGFKAELDVADLASTVLQDEVDVLIVFEETVKLHHVNMIKGSMKFNLAHYLHINRSQIITTTAQLVQTVHSSCCMLQQRFHHELMTKMIILTI